MSGGMKSSVSAH